MKPLTFSLLNTRSLPKDAVHIANDSIIYASDVMCLTETKIVPDQDICPVCHFIKDFNVIRNDIYDKFRSTAFCHRNELGLIGFQGSLGVALLKIRKESLYSKLINVLLIYRKQSRILPTFYDGLATLTTTEDIQTILGDLNMNAFVQEEAILSAFKMDVNFPTHLSGSVIDHVYIKKVLAA